MKKRMEITLEVDRLTLVSNRTSQDLWCDGCSAVVRMLTVDEAAAVASATSRSIFRRVETGELHFAETPTGRLFICLNSLSRKSNQEEHL